MIPPLASGRAIGLRTALPAVLLTFCLFTLPVRAADPAAGGSLRVLPPGQLPPDARLAPPKDLDGYFPFVPPVSREAWQERSDAVRRQILVANGLWPLPERTPLNAVVHGRIDRGDYTVEKVYFESMPGFFVTGNLYRPKGAKGRVPGMLSPHGHWENGRFYDQGVAAVRREIVNGAERFEEGGRSPLQARAVQLARMGVVVFHYDMIGYADSQQLSHDLAHRFAKQRPEMNNSTNWGFFSPAAEAHLQSIMGLQTWNSIRALDFLLELPDVDAERVGVTGASGGGTQSFLLAAIDPRVKLSFPAVMVSTAMQGGCTCENASLLRVNTGNIEFAALFAPKPQGVTSANDWTREMATKGFPELQAVYKLMGAPENVMLKRGEHFEHNYNYVSRAAMYAWVNRQFRLGLAEPIVEADYKRLTRDEMSVWDSAHPKPPAGPEFERAFLQGWKERSQGQLAKLPPDKRQHITRQALAAMVGRTLAEAGPVAWQPSNRVDHGRWSLTTGLIRHEARGEAIPVAWIRPPKLSGHTVVWTHPEGKAGLFENGNPAKPRPEVQALLEAGIAVLGVDLLFQGEFLPEGKSFSETPRVKNPREAAAYTFGYNPSVLASRVGDLLSAVRLLHAIVPGPERIDLVGEGSTGPIVAVARALAGVDLGKAVVEESDFRFGQISDLRDPQFIPGGARYGDLPALLALPAPSALLLMGGKGEVPPEVAAAYLNAATHLKVLPAREKGAHMTNAVHWLTH